MSSAALERYRQLAAKVDGFFARVFDRHRADMSCAAGCDLCCRVELTITEVEALAVRAFVAALSDDDRAHLAANAATSAAATAAGDTRCAALDHDGRCLIYQARPLVCRSHGVPIRIAEPGHLPVVTACPKNFVEQGPAAADRDCVLDQATLSMTLAAIDNLHATATGRPPQRVALAALLAKR